MDNIFRCPYCGHRMVVQEYDAGDVTGFAQLFMWIAYECPECYSRSPMIKCAISDTKNTIRKLQKRMRKRNDALHKDQISRAIDCMGL